MNINDFVEKFKEQFIDADEITVTLETNFRQFDSWDSLTGMSVIVMIEDEFGVKITDVELKQCVTVEDVFNIVKNKKN